MPVVDVPPDTKSPTGGVHAPHEMSAWDEEMTTSASVWPVTGSKAVTCSALTVMLAWLPLAEPDCSLITTLNAPGTLTGWLGWPLTVIACPLMTSPASSELALALPLPSHVASAWDRSRSAWMEMLAAVRLTLATVASALLLLPWPTTSASTTSAARRPPDWFGLTDSSDDSSAPPVAGSGPASPTTIGVKLSTVARSTVASPLNVVPLPAVNPKAGWSCGAGPVGFSQLAKSPAVSVRSTMRFMVPSLRDVPRQASVQAA